MESPVPVSSVAQIETFLSEIESFPLLEGLSRSEILALLESGKMRGTRHRETLYQLGDKAECFSLVLRGAFKLVRSSPKGDDVIMYFSSPGDVIAALIMAQPMAIYPVSVVSMGPSLVLEIPKKTYVDTWSRNGRIVMKMQNLIFNRMSVMQDQKLLNKSPLVLKVAHLLLQLMERYSNESEGLLPIPLTRQEIADSLGSTVESVIRIMSDWSHKGILKTNDQHIEILQPGRVVEILKEIEAT
jgi:CRP/FNR family transcriptional regulator